jgi:hypothetical protein
MTDGKRRIVVGTLADVPPQRKKPRPGLSSSRPRFVHPLPPEDQTGLVIHHDLTPEAQAQVAQIEKLGESLRTAIYTIVAVVVATLVIGGMVYALRPARADDDYYPPRRRRRARRRQALSG